MAFRKKKAAVVDVAAPEPDSPTEADLELQQAMQDLSDANPNRSNKASVNPTCQVDGDTREGQSLVSITGKIQGHSVKLKFKVWVCNEHYAELTGD